MKTRQPSASVAESWNRLMPAVGAVESRLGKALRLFGLGQSEFRALGLLESAKDNEVRLLDLADDLGLDRSSVSRLVSRLETSGLVRRESCGDDRRGVYTVLTDTGRELHQNAGEAYTAALTEALRTIEIPAEALRALAGKQ